MQPLLGHVTYCPANEDSFSMRHNHTLVFFTQEQTIKAILKKTRARTASYYQRDSRNTKTCHALFKQKTEEV